MPSRRLLASFCAALLGSGALAAAATLGPSTATAADPTPLDAAITASAAPGHSWTPGPERYAESKQNNVAVRMSDGTVLKADIDYPADPATGKPAAGPFPVLMTQTPYGKELAGQSGSSAIAIDPYFVKHGYIDVAVDVRGTGDSGGEFDLFSPRQVQDGVALVNWAAKLPHSSGKVGLHGASYLGINQMLTAGSVGANSPLKAIFPIVAANDVYRDTAFMGGIPDSEFDVFYLLGLLPIVNLGNPIDALLTDPLHALEHLDVLLQHAKNTVEYNALFLLKTYLSGPHSYADSYWATRSPASVLSKIVANKIPAYLVGGEYDLFQRGEPLNFAGLQNAWAGRSTTVPMLAGQRTTGRYQLLDGPYTHLQIAIDSSPIDRLQLEWFDTWLKGADTGMAQTKTPLHYYDLGTNTYSESAHYPISGATPTTLYFGGGRTGSALSTNDGALGSRRPTAKTGSDAVTWAPVGSSICGRSQDQWLAGAFTLPATTSTYLPCFTDDRPSQLGPTALTYTTGKFGKPRTIAGPIAASIYATATTKESEWVVDVEDVSPDGTSKPLTQGALLGSQRAVDNRHSWTIDGETVLPAHYYSKAAARPVTPGQVTRYDVEVFPTYATIAAGHRLRVTVTTTDFPHLTPTPQELAQLAGGRYAVQRTATAPSSISIPLR